MKGSVFFLIMKKTSLEGLPSVASKHFEITRSILGRQIERSEKELKLHHQIGIQNSHYSKTMAKAIQTAQEALAVGNIDAYDQLYRTLKNMDEKQCV